MSVPYGQDYDENGFPVDDPGTFPPRGAERSQTADLRILSEQRNGVPVVCNYGDVAAVLANGIPDPPSPDVCTRTDDVGLFYRNQVNNLFGDSEAGKTLLCDYATVQVLASGGRVMRLDLDHNSIDATLNRLLDFGATEDILSDTGRFLYAEPDRPSMEWIVEHASQWKPDLTVVDSVGELMSLFGADSNSADDYTRVHTDILKPLARTGAAVVTIDHISKGSDSRAYGATGTAAKKRVIGGTSIRMTSDVKFTPEAGGSAYLTVHKDRHGGLRRRCPVGDKEPPAGKFVIMADTMRVVAPMPDERNPDELPDPADVAAVAELDPAPTTVKDVRERLRWRNERASKAFRAWRERPRSDEQETAARSLGNVPHTQAGTFPNNPQKEKS